MNELNEAWEQEIANAQNRADQLGKKDVVEYLALRESNDSARKIACEWLMQSFVEIANDINQTHTKIITETQDTHRFEIKNATMVGGLLMFRFGIRQLSIEAGWTRTPQDGFIRGGGLACAKITHFGMAKSNESLMLFRNADNPPQWFVIDDENGRKPFGFANVGKHFQIFID